MNEIKEYKDNVGKLKGILLELHRGTAASSLSEQFHEVISHATETEVEEIQKQLIIEGIPKKKAQKWSRSHLASRVN